MLGGISGVIPDYAYDGGGNSDPVWQAVYPRLWHHMLLFYDDRATLARHYHGVKAYIDYLLQGRQNHALLPPKPRLNHGSWAKFRFYPQCWVVPPLVFGGVRPVGFAFPAESCPCTSRT